MSSADQKDGKPEKKEGQTAGQEDQQSKQLTDQNDAPVIEEAAAEAAPAVKLSTMSYKIDPPIAYLPTVDGLADKEKVKQLRAKLRSHDAQAIEAARAEIGALKLSEAFEAAKTSGKKEQSVAIEDLRLRLEHAECKALYRLGDFKQCLQLVIQRIEQLEGAYPELRELAYPESETAKPDVKTWTKAEYEFTMEESSVKLIAQVTVEDRISYIYLKYKILEARIQKAVGMNHTATLACNAIMTYVKTFYDMQAPSKFWLTAVKAAQLQCTQLCNAKEYDSALRVLANVGEKVTRKVVEHFLPTDAKDVDDAKTLQDNYYSFNYRRLTAQYNVYFYSYGDAESLLRALLRDELAHLGLLKQEAGKEHKVEIDGKVLEAIDTSKIRIEGVYGNDEVEQYSVRGTPLYKMLETLVLFAEVYACKMRKEEALEIYQFVQDYYLKLLGTELTVQNTYLLQLMGEAEQKSATERSSKPLKKAIEYGQKSVEIFEKILGATADKEVNNFLLSIRLQALGDFHRDLEQYEMTEKIYMRCQTMVGNMFGEDHPAIIPYNGNLVSCYSSWKEKKTEYKERMRQITARNLEIATKHFGEKSIHVLYHMSANLINRIALGEINTNAEANPSIKKMREVLTHYHGDAKMLINQQFFQIQLLYAQILQSSATGAPEASIELLRVVSEIYSYVLTAQVKYCRYNMKHPFLEQSYLNMGIFNRSLKKFGESLRTWQRLEELQKDLYGERSPVLLFTWKNLGTCCLGLGQSDQALKHFEASIGLLQEQPMDEDKEAVRTKDKVELLGLKQYLYLTHATDRNFASALEMAESCTELSAELYGPRSRKVATKLHQQATCLLQLGKKDKAAEAIEKAINVWEKPEENAVSIEEKEGTDPKGAAAAEEQASFHRIQYQHLLASVLYMQGRNWDQAIEASERGIKLCQDFKGTQLTADADKQGKEFANIKLKAMARQRNMSALDLREQLNAGKEQDNNEGAKPEAIAISRNTVLLQTAAAYFVASAAVLGYLAYQRRA